VEDLLTTMKLPALFSAPLFAECDVRRKNFY